MPHVSPVLGDVGIYTGQYASEALSEARVTHDPAVSCPTTKCPAATEALLTVPLVTVLAADTVTLPIVVGEVHEADEPQS